MHSIDLESKYQSLTVKQRQVLHFFLNGKTDKEISEELEIKAATVRKYIQNLCDHFSLQSQADGLKTNRREDLYELRNQIFKFSGNIKSGKEKKQDLRIQDLPQDTSQNERDIWRQRPYICLPSQDNEFIGREEEINKLLKFVSLDYRAPIITVDGIGGVGKTALVLEVAYRCLEASIKGVIEDHVPIFESIIFVSAKVNYLLPTGITNRLERNRNLQDIFRVIGRTLEDKKINQVVGNLRVSQVYECLSKQKTLLIVDNLETIEDKEDVISFLSDLPSSTKAIITTRERVVLYGSLRLDSLPQEDALKLIAQQSQQKDIPLSKKDSLKIYNFLGGVPVAIIYVIGQLAMGFTLENIIGSLNGVPEDIGRFCFSQSIEIIKNRAAHKILMSLSIFSRSPNPSTLIKVSGFETDSISFEKGVAELQQLSLVYFADNRYKILPLTREFSASELIAHSDFHHELRERWIKWYVEFSDEHGNRDWEEWHIEYDQLDDEWPNLLAVLNWCASDGRYDDIKNLWPKLNQFASLYGYWNDRLEWLLWLYKEAERHGDLGQVYWAQVDRAYTLIEMENLEEAQKLLVESWNVRYLGTANNRVFLVQNLALLRISQKKYKSALLWISKADKLVGLGDFSDKSKERREIVNLSLRAEVYYGIKEFEEAKNLFLVILEKSEIIGWQRRRNYARRKLAEIAIVYKDFKKAEELLKAGFGETERNKSKKDIAQFQRTFALLEKEKGNVEASHKWSNDAREGFLQLGMHQQASEMAALWLST